MKILIDGYNLLHVTGIFSDAVGPGSVEKLHAAMLDFLATSLDPADVPHTTVVFDAKGRRAKSRRTYRYGDITVHYSARDEDADNWLAELINQHDTPRQLVVVSSDHQVQRAARRRRAKPVNSEVWYSELLRKRRERRRIDSPDPDAKPATPLSPNDTETWLNEFGSETPDEPASAPGEPTSVSGRALAPGEPPATTHATENSETDVFPKTYLDQIQKEINSGDLKAPAPKARSKKPGKSQRKRS